MLTAAGGSLLPTTRTHAIEAFQRPAHSNMKLGLAAYSLRDSFEHASHERPQAVAKAKRISLFDFLDLQRNTSASSAQEHSGTLRNPFRFLRSFLRPPEHFDLTGTLDIKIDLLRSSAISENVPDLSQ